MTMKLSNEVIMSTIRHC